MNKTSVLPSLAVAILGLGACSAGPPEGRAAAQDTVSSVPRTGSSPSLDRFEAAFRAVAGNQLQPLRRAQRRAAPGSLARAYFTNQADQVEADLAGGDDATSGDLTKVDGGFRLCYPDDDGQPCYVYGDLTARRGALAAFTVNSGSLRGRLAVGDGSVVRTPLADVEFRSAYVAADGSLVTVFSINAKQALQIDGSTSYRAPSGAVRQFGSSSGLDDLPVRSSGWVYFRFPGPLTLGGTVDVTMFPSEGSGRDATAAVRIG